MRSNGSFPPTLRLGRFCAGPKHRKLSWYLFAGRRGEQRQVKFTDELVMRIDAIRADTDNHGIGFRYRIDSVAEPARFLGSARCIVFRIKPQNNVLAGVIGQRMLLAIAPR